MKTLIALIIISLFPMIVKADFDFNRGVWKHHYVQTHGLTTRLSFKEASMVPTYGLHYGARFAYEIYLDVWGNIGARDIEYKLTVKNNQGSEEVFEGALEYDNDSHQYVAIARTQSKRVFLQANGDYEHILEVIIDGQISRYELQL